MGLARIAIAVLAVVLALGLLIVGGTALWGALTKDTNKGAAPSPSASAPAASGKPTARHSKQPPVNPAGNVIQVQCLATQCPIFVAGPGPTDVLFNGPLNQNAQRVFNETHLTLSVDDASTVSVTINGQ